MSNKIFFILFFGGGLFMLSSPALAVTNITSCQPITTGGQYALNQSFVANQTNCITWTSVDNVEIDCNSFSITTSNQAFGIIDSTTSDNVTVTECSLSNSDTNPVSGQANLITITSATGPFLITGNTLSNPIASPNRGIVISTYLSTTGTITNNTILNTYIGVEAIGVANLNVSNNTINGSTSSGIHTTGDSTSIQISRNVIGGSGDDGDIFFEDIGVLIFNNLLMTVDNWIRGDDNLINTTSQTGSRIFGTGTLIGGNVYTNSSRTGGYYTTCADSQPDGICDVQFVPGTGIAIDRLPLSDGLDDLSPQITTRIISPTNNTPQNVVNIYTNISEDVYSISTVFVQVINPSGTRNNYTLSLNRVISSSYPIIQEWTRALINAETETEGTYYVEYFFANDSQGNLNRTLYNQSFTIATASQGGTGPGGGGGGDDDVTTTLNLTSSQSVYVQSPGKKLVEIQVANNKEVARIITFTATGPNKAWADLTTVNGTTVVTDTFTIPPNKVVNVGILISVPEEIEDGKYPIVLQFIDQTGSGTTVNIDVNVQNEIGAFLISSEVIQQKFLWGFKVRLTCQGYSESGGPCVEGNIPLDVPVGGILVFVSFVGGLLLLRTIRFFKNHPNYTALVAFIPTIIIFFLIPI